LYECKLATEIFLRPEILNLKASPRLSEMKIGDTIFFDTNRIKELERLGKFYNLRYFRDVNDEDIKSDNQMSNADFLYRNELPNEVKDFVYKEQNYCSSKKLYEFIQDTTNFADWIVITSENIKLDGHNSIEFLTNAFANWVGSNKTNNLLKNGTTKANLYDYINQPLKVELNYSTNNVGIVCFRLPNGFRLGVSYINKNPNAFTNSKNKLLQEKYINDFQFRETVVYDNEELFFFDEGYFPIYEVLGFSFKNDNPSLICNIRNGLKNKQCSL